MFAIMGAAAPMIDNPMFEPGWVVLQATDGFVAERDALASQLLVVGQQLALTDQQPHR